MLNGTDILVTGSSLMRHLFIALLTILKGDINYGSLRPNTKPGKTNVSDYPIIAHSSQKELANYVKFFWRTNTLEQVRWGNVDHGTHHNLTPLQMLL